MVVVGRLRNVSSDLVDFIAVEVERDEQRERVLSRKTEKRKFEGRCDLLVGRKRPWRSM